MITKHLWSLHHISKTVISPKTILFLRLLGGQYSKICSNRLVCAVTAVYCIAFSCYAPVQILILLAQSFTPTSVQSTAAVTIFLSSALTSFWYPEYFQIFQNDMAAIDIVLRGKSELDIPLTRVLLIAVVVSHVSTIVPFAINGVLEGRAEFQISKFLFVAYFVLQNGITYLMAVMVFEILWYRVRKFREHLENCLPRVCRAQDLQAATEDICKCLQLYQNILEAFKKTNVPIKIAILTATAASFFKVIAGVFELITSSSTHIKVLRIHEAVLDSVLPLTPAVLAALIQGELNRIKLFIGNLILNAKDESVHDALCDCQLYLQHRPFRYSVWRLFTVDLSLVVSVINLYVTSLIAMIQFGHFYN